MRKFALASSGTILRSLCLLVPACAALAVACGSGSDETAGGDDLASDAGVASADASSAHDAATSTPDAAKPVTDAGAPDVAPPPTYAVGGQVTGLVTIDGGVPADGGATKLVLQNDAKDDLAVAGNGPFTFATKLTSGSAYGVTVKTQPFGHACAATNASGTIASADVTNVAVACSPSQYTVTVRTTGLHGSGLVVQNNGAGDLAIAADGDSAFATKVAFGSSYAVTVLTSPSYPTQKCSVANGTGTAFGDALVTVTCADDLLPLATYPVDDSFDIAAGQVETYPIALAWNGESYWVGSGGNTNGNRLASYDAAFAYVASYPAAVDFRSLFTLNGKGATVYARGFNSNAILVKAADNTFSPTVTLAGGLDSQTFPVFDSTGAEIVALWGGIVHRWKFADGSALPNVTLNGYGGQTAETGFNALHVLASSGYYITVANGVASVWDPATGDRLKSATLTDAPTNFEGSLSISYARGRIWMIDGSGAGKWRSWNIGL